MTPSYSRASNSATKTAVENYLNRVVYLMTLWQTYGRNLEEREHSVSSRWKNVDLTMGYAVFFRSMSYE